jgi:N utilization substance protein A
VLEEAASCHPFLAGGGGSEPNLACSGDDYAAGVFQEALPPHPPRSAVLDFDRAALARVRALVAAEAQRAGLDGDRVPDLVTAASELAANSVAHGGGRGSIRVWQDSRDMVVEVGRIEAVLPRKEQSRAESYAPSDRVRAVIKGVNRSAKGPQIVLSRTDPALLIKLFEQEVPEIYDGTVQIRGAVREAGDRAKVAVFSRERDVDPVGACVGMKGTRVQSIIRELRGEKIDIVEWSEDPVLFVTNALSPAKVQRVSIVDDRERVMEVVVEDKQLSLAIGKKGQNVRLAAKLTGWRIDIKSEEEKRREVEAQFEGLEMAAAEAADSPETQAEGAEGGAAEFSLPGVSDKIAQKLVEAGFTSQEQIAAASVEALSEVPGIGPKTSRRSSVSLKE